MATYTEISDLLTENPNLGYINRVTMAVLVKATLVAADVAATANAKVWANNIIAQAIPRGAAVEIFTKLLMSNRAVNLTAIKNILDSDSSTQTQVSNFIDTYLATLG